MSLSKQFMGISEAKSALPRVVNAINSGETDHVFVMRNNRPVAVIVSPQYFSGERPVSLESNAVLSGELPPQVDNDRIARFSNKWGIKELALFGSAVRGELTPSSDIDILVSFQEGSGITFESRPEMIEELTSIFGREIDLVDQRQVRNPFRRQAILDSRKVLYVA